MRTHTTAPIVAALVACALVACALVTGRASAQLLADPVTLAGSWSCSTPEGRATTVRYDRRGPDTIATTSRFELPDGTAAEIPETLHYSRDIGTWRLTAPETAYSGGYTLTAASPDGSDWTLRGRERIGATERDARIDYSDAGDDAFRRVRSVRYGDAWRVADATTCRRIAARAVRMGARTTDHAYELAGDPFACVTSNGFRTTYAFALRNDGTLALDEAAAPPGGDDERESYRFDPRSRRWLVRSQRSGFSGAAGVWHDKSWTFDGTVGTGTHAVPMRVRYVYFDANKFSRAFYAVDGEREAALVWETCRRRTPPELTAAVGTNPAAK